MNLLLLAVAGFVAVAGDWCLKRFADGSGPWPLAQGLLLYIVSVAAFGLSLRLGPLLMNGAVYVVLNGMGVLLLSRFVFHEVISVRQWAGLALAVVGIVLMEI